MTERQEPRFVDLPGVNPARIDANTVICARVETTDSVSYVVLHTDQGFGFSIVPPNDQSVIRFYQDVLSVLWPGQKARRSNKNN